MSKEDLLTFKIITIGDSNVGKTSIIRRYIYNIFDENTMSTIGISFCFKEVTLKSGTKISLKLVDTAGEEKYRALTKSYFKNTEGVLFVFDYSNINSFENITNWIKIFEENHNGKGIPKYLIGNKSDLRKKVSNPVDEKEIDKLLKQERFKDYKFESTSALENENIDKIFEELSETMYENYQKSPDKGQKNVLVKKYEKKKKKNGNCICHFD